MTARCLLQGCGKPAVWQVGFKIWAAGHPRLARNCLQCLASIVVCDACRDRVDVKDFLLPEGKERIARALLAMGRAAPDFSTAELCFVPIVDTPIDVTKPGGFRL